MANKATLQDLRNDELITFYRQALSWYAVRKFIRVGGDTVESTPEEIAKEIEKRYDDSRIQPSEL